MGNVQSVRLSGWRGWATRLAGVCLLVIAVGTCSHVADAQRTPAGPTTLPSVHGQSGKFLTNDGSRVSWGTAGSSLPSQTGNSGKYLTTNGSSASWGSVSGVPDVLFSPADIGAAQDTVGNDFGAVTQKAGDFTTGVRFRMVKAGKSVSGVKFYTKFSGAITARVHLWDSLGGGSLALKDQSVTGPGEFTILFTSPVAVTDGKNYCVSVYQTTGAHYTNMARGTYPMAATSGNMWGGPTLVFVGAWDWYRSSGGDGNPDTEDGTDVYPVEPVFQ